MAKYFEQFPLIEYECKLVRDITRRTNFTKEVSNNPLMYLPYTVKAVSYTHLTLPTILLV